MNKYKILTLLFLLLSIGVESQALTETEQTQIQTEEEKIDIQLQNLMQRIEELMENESEQMQNLKQRIKELMETESEQNSQNEYYLKLLEFYQKEYYLKLLEFHQAYLNAIFIEASKAGDIETLNRTLEQGADVDARDQYGLRALMWATKYGHIDIVKILAPKVADIDARVSSKDWTFFRNDKNNGIAKPYNGLTAFRVALKEKNYEIAKVLLDNGAYINARDSDGRTALVRASAKIYNTPFDLKEYSSIELRLDLNDRELEDFTNTVLANLEINLEVMEFLIENGADVNVRDDDGKTALIYVYSVPTDSLPSKTATAAIELLKKHDARK